MNQLGYEIIYQLLEQLRFEGPLSAEVLLGKVAGNPIFQNISLPVDTVGQILSLTRDKDWTKITEINGKEQIVLTGDGMKIYYINKKTRDKVLQRAYQQANPITFVLSPAKGYEERYETFLEKYELINAIIPLETPSSIPKDEANKVCRFCRQHFPDVRFTQDTHMISDMLGRNSLYSDFERDSCNNFFGSTYESDLANYLGIARTLTQTKGKERVPSFTSPGEVIKAKYQKMWDEPSIVISRENTSNDAIVTDVENGQILLKITKNPFTPIKVYKAFLKIVLSVLREKEMSHYHRALDLLLGKEKIMDKGFVISGYSLPFSYSLPPHAFVFEKREKDAAIPTHIVAIYFANSIFAIPILLHDEDVKKWRKNPDIELPLYPALFTQFTDVMDIPIVPFQEDFSSEQVMYDSKQEIILKIAQEELDKMSVYNKATGQIKASAFSPAEITRIIMRNTNRPIDPAKLFSE